MTSLGPYETQAEALACRDGIAYVNDSAITVVGVRMDMGKWFLDVEDRDEDYRA